MRSRTTFASGWSGIPIPSDIYSGQTFEASAFIEEAFAIEARREALRASFRSSEAFRSVSEVTIYALLEESVPYDCEHSVPQSLFRDRNRCAATCNTIRISTGERIATSCDACERGKRLLSDHVHLQDVCDPLGIRAERIAQIEKDRTDVFHAIPLIISRSHFDKFC